MSKKKTGSKPNVMVKKDNSMSIDMTALQLKQRNHVDIGFRSGRHMVEKDRLRKRFNAKDVDLDE